MADNERDIINEDESSKAPVWLVVAGIVVILMAIFVGQNSEEIEFQFLTATFTMPLWFVLVLVFVLGAIAGQALVYMRRRRRRRADKS